MKYIKLYEEQDDPEKEVEYYEGGRKRELKYYDSGQIAEETWWKNSGLHREGAPAFIIYFPNGQIHREWWFVNSVRHREDGPAVIFHTADGSRLYEEWWVKDKNITSEINDLKENGLSGEEIIALLKSGLIG